MNEKDGNEKDGLPEDGGGPGPGAAYSSRSSSLPLRRELLVAFSVLLVGAVLVTALGLVVLLPFLGSPREVLAYVLILLVTDLAVLSLFGAWILRTTFVKPVEKLVADVRKIAAGDYRQRIEGMSTAELGAIQESVNELADRLIRDQRALAENVASLERTNRELVEARAEVVQAARLASVGTLAAGIAHEVGNPLGAILGYVDVARRRAEREGRDVELLDSIREEAVRIDRIVRGLLDYARPEDTELRPVHPARVLRRVREILDSQGRLGEVDDVWELEEDVPLVLMEPHRLEQAMVNILLNALQAMEGRESGRGLRVTLTAEAGEVARMPPRRGEDPPGINYLHRRRVAPGQEARGLDPALHAHRMAVIRVEDEGPGISEEDVERVFDPFFTTKEPGKGTGLGLSIGARLVEGMGGRIEAGTRGPDGGAVFTVRLPGVRTEEGEGGEPERRETDGSPPGPGRADARARSGS